MGRVPLEQLSRDVSSRVQDQLYGMKIKADEMRSGRG